MNARFPLPLFRTPREVLRLRRAARFVTAIVGQVIAATLGTLLLR